MFFLIFFLVDGRIRIQSKKRPVQIMTTPGPKKTYGSYRSGIGLLSKFLSKGLDLGFIIHTGWYTLSMGGDQSAMEPSWTMVSVMGYGNWDRIVFPANMYVRQGVHPGLWIRNDLFRIRLRFRILFRIRQRWSPPRESCTVTIPSNHVTSSGFLHKTLNFSEKSPQIS
jgi:hypothetical protein